jgi:hypothetical protein
MGVGQHFALPMALDMKIPAEAFSTRLRLVP